MNQDGNITNVVISLMNDLLQTVKLNKEYLVRKAIKKIVATHASQLIEAVPNINIKRFGENIENSIIDFFTESSFWLNISSMTGIQLSPEFVNGFIPLLMRAFEIEGCECKGSD